MEALALEVNKDMVLDLSFEALEDVVAPGDFWNGFLTGVGVAGTVAGGIALGIALT